MELGCMDNDQVLLESKLPFDQYSRQKIVAYIIENSIRKISNKKKLKIIDLGGHKGKTTNFQPNDDVTVLDVFDEIYDNYVKGDATDTNFPDDTFDLSCSFDVLEHIPREKRQAFIDEALRISKYGLFVAMPIDTEDKVSSAEMLLDNFHKIMFASDHKWLKEHIDYRIPNEKEINELVKKSGAHSVSIFSNQIGDWQLMQMLIFSAARNPEITGYVNDINSWYNRHTIELDTNIDIGYRGVFFISKDKKNIESVSQAIFSLKNKKLKTKQYVTINEKTFGEFSRALAKIGKKYTDLLDKYSNIDKTKIEIIEKNAELKGALINSQDHNKNLTNELSDVYSSASWKITKPIRLANRLMQKRQKSEE